MKRGFLGYSKKKPADSRTIRKSTREESIDTLQAASIDSVNQKSINNVDENGMLRDKEGRTRNNAGQLINAQGAVIPDLLDYIMAKRDEQHVSGKLSKVVEAGTENATSTSIDDMTSTSPDGTTSTSTYITTSTSINVPTSSSIDDVDREVTMEDSSEMEVWLKDIDQNSEKKLDDDQHTSRGDLETSKASIDRHHPPNIDRCPLLDVPPGCIIEMEPIQEMMYMSLNIRDHLSGQKKLLGFRKESVHLDSYSEILDDHQHVEASQRGLRFQDDVDKGPAEPVSIDNDRIPSIDTNKPASIDTTTSPSIDTTASTSIGAITSPSIDTGRVLEQKDLMGIPPRDQTSLGERRGGIGRIEKGSSVILSYH
ncbi:hypothetical protein F2Q69_00014059 [Brassica cretica]|uniref:Uncharacterized protein n=1 Tax=Brassica cretica TaxID=69181 RepID=A0A8S9R4F2_BRACR|nr:hypothetical protein F2Q69_00014059 [Brassica cretica]